MYHGAQVVAFSDNTSAGTTTEIAAPGSDGQLTVMKIIVSISTPSTTITDTIDFDDGSAVKFSCQAGIQRSDTFDFTVPNLDGGIPWGAGNAVRLIVPTGCVASVVIIASKRESYS